MEANTRHLRMAGKIIFMALFFVLGITGPLYAAAGSARALLEEAQEAYRAKEDERALQLFLTFRKAYPEDKEADDALWYIGRLYNRMGKPDQAMESFQILLTLPERSKFFLEASYDLAKIYYKQRWYKDDISLLEPLKKEKNLDPYDLKLLQLLGRSRYYLGQEYEKDNKHRLAEKEFLESARIYTLLIDGETVKEKKVDNLLRRAKSFEHLQKLARKGNTLYSDKYKKSAQQSLQQALLLNTDKEKEKYLKGRLSRITSTKGISSAQRSSAQKPSYGIRAELLGKTNSSAEGMGSFIFMNASFKTPKRDNHQYHVSGFFRHDDFSLKTSNLESETDDEEGRLIQRTDAFSLQAAWLTGMKTPFNTKLSLRAVYLLAEDERDNYRSLRLAERITYSFDKNRKLGFLWYASWKKYPEYFISGRQADHISVKLAPDITWPVNRAFDLNLGYAFYLKEYLEAKYDRKPPDESVDLDDFKGAAEDDKRYLRHCLTVKALIKEKGGFRPSLKYTFTFNKSENYDKIIVDRPGEMRFIEDYFDYQEHTLTLDADMRWSTKIKTDLKASCSLTRFDHYPAMDKGYTFIDEKRRDIAYQLDGGTQYLIRGKKQNNISDIWGRIQISYTNKSSNMEYEVSSETNYDFITVSAGLVLKLP